MNSLFLLDAVVPTQPYLVPCILCYTVSTWNAMKTCCFWIILNYI